MQEKRKQLWSLMGDLPDRKMPVDVQTLKVEKIEGGTLELLQFKYPDEPAFQGYFVLPDRRNGKIPAILYNHSHGSLFHLGKDELLQGAPYQNGPYLPDLLNAGYAVLTIDHRAFGSRSDRKIDDIFKEMLWRGQVLWGMMLYDSVRALDYLCSREEVDAERIGTVGMSMGSTMAWYLAAVDERIKVCADICCMTDFEELIKAEHLCGHGTYYFVPRLLKYFATAAINALIAPRPHISVNGKYDGLTPEAGLDKVDAALKTIYQNAGCPEHWKMIKYPVQHQEVPEM
ncbi:MAG: acetylxylan esterase, partial [Lentisphaeria bacterium]|nr:acetylxylan esterase [Lentisphaeria bacterium]